MTLIKKIPGVNDASISFMAQKLTIDADYSRFDKIMAEAQNACANVDIKTADVGKRVMLTGNRKK